MCPDISEYLHKDDTKRSQSDFILCPREREREIDPELVQEKR